MTHDILKLVHVGPTTDDDNFDIKSQKYLKNGSRIDAMILEALHPELRHGSSRVAISSPGRCSVVKTLDVSLPLSHIHTLNPPVVGQKSVDLALDVRCLCPNTTTAGYFRSQLSICEWAIQWCKRG